MTSRNSWLQTVMQMSGWFCISVHKPNRLMRNQSNNMRCCYPVSVWERCGCLILFRISIIGGNRLIGISKWKSVRSVKNSPLQHNRIVFAYIFTTLFKNRIAEIFFDRQIFPNKIPHSMLHCAHFSFI